jgi:hypothetical protein
MSSTSTLVFLSAPLARKTHAMVLFHSVPVGILRCKQMTGDATFAPRLFGAETVTTQNVLALGDYFNMGRVTTAAVATGVIRLVAIRDVLAIGQYPGQAVWLDVDLFTAVDAQVELAVAAVSWVSTSTYSDLTDPTQPRPAMVWFAYPNLGPKPAKYFVFS